MKDESEFKTDFGARLTAVRKEMNLTQQQLAEKINYSDKAVSKWERGESVPDIYTVCDICDKLGTSLDYLCGRDIPFEEQSIKKQKSKSDKRKAVSIFVPAISVFGVLFLCSTLYFILKNISVTADYAFLAFGLSVPVAFTVLLVLSFVWWHYREQFICLSGLIWSVGIFAYEILKKFTALQYSSYFFISCAILQIIAILVFVFARALKANKK